MSNKIRLNLDLWTHIDYQKFVQAQTTGKGREALTLARQVIVSWDYPIDLSDPRAAFKLSVEDSADLTMTVWKTVNQQIEELEFGDVTVNFRKWDTERFFEFAEAQSERNYALAETMLHEVASMEGASPEKPLTFTQGVKMQKAVGDKYKKIVTGKN